MLNRILFLCFVIAAGCSRQDDTVRTLIESGNVEFGNVQEDFDRAFEVLDSLESVPCLPNTAGYEKIINIANRLDQWILKRKADDTWKNDAELAEVENSARIVAASSREIADLIKTMQTGTAALEDGGDKKLAAALQRFAGELEQLSSKAGVPAVKEYVKTIAGLRRKIDALSKIPNLDAAKIRAFAKQLDVEISDFSSIATMVNSYADQFAGEKLTVRISDVEYIKQTTWMRNISYWARGEKQTLPDRIRELYDWTICNVEERSNIIKGNLLPQQYPWQTLLLGFGTAQDRAAVFIELLRQQRIDAAILDDREQENDKEQRSEASRCLVGVLVDSKVYRFNMSGNEVKNNGTPADLAPFKALIPVFPESASMRMKILEGELTGSQTMVLYTDVAEMRRRWSNLFKEHVQIWKFPLRTAFEQQTQHEITDSMMVLYSLPSIRTQDLEIKEYPLWTGRILYFKGKMTGQNSAMTHWQDALISDKELLKYRGDMKSTHRQSDMEEYVQTVTAYANYFLGLASFEIGSMPAAQDFLNTLLSAPGNTWKSNARYILGRIAEEKENREGQK